MNFNCGISKEWLQIKDSDVSDTILTVSVDRSILNNETCPSLLSFVFSFIIQFASATHSALKSEAVRDRAYAIFSVLPVKV